MESSIIHSVFLFRRYTFASGSADNIKQWMFPDGSFIQNLSGHNAIINTLAVNSDGVLVSGGDDTQLHLQLLVVLGYKLRIGVCH